MSRIPIVRRRLAGTVAAVLVGLALTWPRGFDADPLARHLLGMWRRISFAADQAPPGLPPGPAPGDTVDPKEGKGPSVDPDGSSATDPETPSGDGTAL